MQQAIITKILEEYIDKVGAICLLNCKVMS